MKYNYQYHTLEFQLYICLDKSQYEYQIQFEIDFLTTYLPEQLSEEEVEKIVDDVLAELGDVDMSQMGRVIGAVMAKGDGIDGSIVSKVVKGKLN